MVVFFRYWGAVTSRGKRSRQNMTSRQGNNGYENFISTEGALLVPKENIGGEKGRTFKGRDFLSIFGKNT